MRKTLVYASKNVDGVSGDGNGKEVKIAPYYNGNWLQVIRLPTSERHILCDKMVEIANNNNIGYNMNDRYSLLTKSKNCNFKDVKVKCNVDCSSMVMIALTKVFPKNKVLYKNVYGTTTYNMVNILKKCELPIKIYNFKSQTQLKKGDILLAENHVVVVK